MNFNQRFSRRTGITALFGLWPLAGWAHHSAAQFDFMHTRTVEGVVAVFEVKNPHAHAVIDVTEGGKTRQVEFEGHSASNFYRAGYSRDAVHSGEHITLLIAPRKDGADGGFILSFKTEKGLVVGFGGLVPGGGASKSP